MLPFAFNRSMTTCPSLRTMELTYMPVSTHVCMYVRHGMLAVAQYDKGLRQAGADALLTALLAGGGSTDL